MKQLEEKIKGWISEVERVNESSEGFFSLWLELFNSLALASEELNNFQV